MAMIIMVVMRMIMVVMIMPALRPTGVIMLVSVVMTMIMVMMMVVMIMMRMIIRFEKVRLQLQDTIEIESLALQHSVERHIRFHATMQRRIGVNAPDARLDLRQFFFCHQIGLVQNDDVGESDLRFRFGRVFQTVAQPFGVSERHHRIKLRRIFDVGVDKEGLRHRRRIGEAGGLNDDRIKLAAPAHQPFNDADQIAAHRAADTAVVHLEDFLVGADDEIIVDADFTEFIDDHRIATTMLFGENTVQQRRLAGAEIAGKNGHGNFIGHRLSWPLLAERYGRPCAIPLRASALFPVLSHCGASCRYRWRRRLWRR